MPTLDLITELAPHEAPYAFARAKAEVLIGQSEKAAEHLKDFLARFPNDLKSKEARAMLSQVAPTEE
jgi:TolA-binding protein